jgi:hypothetical protein
VQQLIDRGVTPERAKAMRASEAVVILRQPKPAKIKPKTRAWLRKNGYRDEVISKMTGRDLYVAMQRIRQGVGA